MYCGGKRFRQEHTDENHSRLLPPVGGTLAAGHGLRKNTIGYLPQQTDVQKDFPASVREIVLSGCQARCGLRPFYRRAEKQLAADAMEKMHITPLAKRCYRELPADAAARAARARVRHP